MSGMVRINTRISKTLNDWLDKRSRETGVPKSTLVFLAIEQYMQQQKAMDMVEGLSSVVEAIKGLESKIDAQLLKQRSGSE
jgi:predicted DNA-binding protein